METVKSFAWAEEQKELAKMPLARRTLSTVLGRGELRKLSRAKAGRAEIAERDEVVRMIGRAAEMSREQMVAAKSQFKFASTQALLDIALFALAIGELPKIAGLQEDPSIRDCQRMANEARRTRRENARPFWTGSPFCAPAAAALNEAIQKRAAGEAAEKW